MTLRNLPKIHALSELPSSDGFTVPDHALKRWNAGVRAAHEGEDNIISIYDVIGQDWWSGEGVTSKRIAAALRRIGEKDVVVNLNSPGGDFFEGIAIYNLLREHPHKVTVKVMGLAASAASIIAMAGDDIQISEIGFLMVHNAWAVAVGNRNDLREAADTLEPFDDAMAGLYAARAGVEKAEAASWMDKETWFNGTQAIEIGLADSYLASGEISQEQIEDPKSFAAVRRVEAALARQGMPRKECKTLIAELKGGTRDAAADATRDAGDLSADLRRLIDTIPVKREPIP